MPCPRGGTLVAPASAELTVKDRSPQRREGHPYRATLAVNERRGALDALAWPRRRQHFEAIAGAQREHARGLSRWIHDLKRPNQAPVEQHGSEGVLTNGGGRHRQGIRFQVDASQNYRLTRALHGFNRSARPSSPRPREVAETRVARCNFPQLRARARHRSRCLESKIPLGSPARVSRPRALLARRPRC
jgi:hypothetical protein